MLQVHFLTTAPCQCLRRLWNLANLLLILKWFFFFNLPIPFSINKGSPCPLCDAPFPAPLRFKQLSLQETFPPSLCVQLLGYVD